MSLRIVIFGSSISSSWGNGHATLWRGLCKSLHAMDHHVVFYERNLPASAPTRDLASSDDFELVLYDDFAAIESRAASDVESSDATIVTSRCADAPHVAELMASKKRLSVFYDLDAPATLSLVAEGQNVPYLPASGYREFDLVLSSAGGQTLSRLEKELGAKRALPLYACVDPDAYFPAHVPTRSCELSYLGAYAPDRQALLAALFLESARQSPDARMVLGGANYPRDIELPRNVQMIEHVEPQDHSAFYGSSGLTLNLTRAPAARSGFCPSSRFFEAAAAATPIITDIWPGLETFFEPGTEAIVARSTEDVLRALALSAAERARIAVAARRRVLAHHTSTKRAHELVDMLTGKHVAAATVRTVAPAPSS